MAHRSDLPKLPSLRGGVIRIEPGGCVKAVSALSLVALITACGGGGGGGSSGLSYSGAITPASLTTTNSATLLSDAYAEGSTAANIDRIGSVASLTNSTHDAPRRPRSLALSEALVTFIRLSATGNTLNAPSAAAAVTTIPTNTVDGGCGGAATINGSYDDVSGAISVTTTFNSYCQHGTTLNGAISASGNAVISSSSIVSISNLSISVSNLTADMAGGDFFTASGTLSIVPQSGYTSIATHSVITINMLFKDNITAKVYKLANYDISQTVTLGYNDVVITGRYYDPDAGYIDLSTPTTIRAAMTDLWPSSGKLKGTGNGSSATLTALDNTTYQLDVDTDNNGTPESTTTGLWVDL
jgi:hypothetical protein